jgi:hypothetical protein
MRLFQSKEKKPEVDAARSAYAEFAVSASSSNPSEARALAASFKENSQVASLSPKERAKHASDALRTYAENVLADDRLTSEEENAFVEVVTALGIEDEEFQAQFSDLFDRILIAQVNDGRLPVIAEPVLIAKQDEVFHLEVMASLMKEVVLREFVGGSSGVSFRIAKGVSFRTSGFRGRSVVVGTELQAAESGLLVVSSQRVAYMGKTTFEFPYSKLMYMEVFTDGIRVHVSNRQTASLFKVKDGQGQVIAATVNAAAQKLID